MFQTSCCSGQLSMYINYMYNYKGLFYNAKVCWQFGMNTKFLSIELQIPSIGPLSLILRRKSL